MERLMRLGKTPRQLPVFAGGVSGANSARLGTKSIPRLRGWSGRRELNPRPTAWKAETLPLSYSRPGNSPAQFQLYCVAPRMSSGGGAGACLQIGIEPATNSLEG